MFAPRTFAAFAAAAAAVAAVAVTAGTGKAAPPPSLAAHGGSDFAQLSSGIDQEQNGNVKSVQFEHVDGIHGLTAGKDSVTVEHDGMYMIVVAPQVFTEEGGVQRGKDPTRGCADTWFNVNDQDVPNSSVRLCQAAAHSTHVVVAQTVTPLKAGDVLRVKAKGDDVKFDATQPSEGPLIPSVILSVARVS
ncbi:hypothetical protein ACFY2W_35205 [Streptomyces sp. NPDC001262]|uniref:hypothetical protein n=1 Tax=unclassified Streptomyces TaxID=2593676 RepID=UPI0036B274F2